MKPALPSVIATTNRKAIPIRGPSPGWKFDDSLQYDWVNLTAQYQGFLHRPNEDEPVFQELEHALDDPDQPGFYVDKLTPVLCDGLSLWQQ